MGSLQVTSQRNGESVILTISGELDISTAGDVEKELADVERERPPVVLLDLRPLTFIDSTGLRLILSADLRARRDGRRLAIVRGPDRVHRVFLIALLDKRLDFVDEPAALMDC